MWLFFHQLHCSGGGGGGEVYGRWEKKKVGSGIAKVVGTCRNTYFGWRLIIKNSCWSKMKPELEGCVSSLVHAPKNSRSSPLSTCYVVYIKNIKEMNLISYAKAGETLKYNWTVTVKVDILPMLWNSSWGDFLLWRPRTCLIKKEKREF